MPSEQDRWRRREGDYPIGHALVCERWQIIAIPQPDSTWIVRQPGTRERKYESLEQINAEIDKMDMQQNPTRVQNGPGLGGFLGSLGGVIVSGAIGALGAPAVVAVPLGIALSVGGGAAGARYAADPDNKKSATTWGGVGGAFGPIGAGIGGYFAGQEGRRENPSTAAVVGGTVAVVGTAALAYVGIKKWREHRAAKALPPVPTPNPRGLRSTRHPRRLSLRA